VQNGPPADGSRTSPSDAPALILESGLSMVDAEIEAIPEIRVHAADLARRLVSTTLR